jgi:Kef-type K+ transport system membrane component KefB
MFLILKILGIFTVLLIGALFIIPKILQAERLWKSRGSIEGIVAASFFGASGLSAVVRLSPIVGAGVLLDSLASLFWSYSSWQL